MALFDRFRSQPAPERTIEPDRRVRGGQLMQLETTILDLMDEMQRLPQWRNPGWQAQVLEFYEVLAQIRSLRAREYAWDELVDLGFQVRPVMRSRGIAPEFAHLDELQQRMMRLAGALTEPMPDEIHLAAHR